MCGTFALRVCGRPRVFVTESLKSNHVPQQGRGTLGPLARTRTPRNGGEIEKPLQPAHCEPQRWLARRRRCSYATTYVCYVERCLSYVYYLIWSLTHRYTVFHTHTPWRMGTTGPTPAAKNTGAYRPDPTYLTAARSGTQTSCRRKDNVRS
jgi:hypothetical protein